MERKIIYTVVLILFLGFSIFSIQGVTQKNQSQQEDILSVRGINVTGGAAPNYVEDRVCAMCHNEKFRSYQLVGMSRSFYRPRADKFIENFKESRFYHKPSNRYYEINREGDQLFFKRYQLDQKSNPINIFSIKIDWIMGSGNHSRVYIYQTEQGELYQLPLAWYTQTKSWGMSPGYDNPNHMGVTRRIRHECMFCHNAYPDIPKGKDMYDGPQELPVNLPEGTGCQRCHGPGANHVRLVFSGEINPEKIHSTIVNPNRLTPQLRNDICHQCHLQPSVALFGVRRFNRADYSYRPGEKLTDYLLQMDITEEGKEKSERFEINHHPYRLMQSRCFKESNWKLSCLTCHNPHRKVPPEEREDHYRKACLSCHKTEQCNRTPHATNADAPGNCIECHMPLRRTQDVVNVIMTDHYIQRQAPAKELRLAPLKETQPIVTDAAFFDPEHAPKGDLGELYRIITVFRAGGTYVLDTLESTLEKVKPPEIIPYIDLARGQINKRRFEAAQKTIDYILQKDPNYDQAKELLGIVLSGLNQLDEAIKTLKKIVESNENPEAEVIFNLGRLMLAKNQLPEAIKYLQLASKKRPPLAQALYHLGNAQVKNNRLEEATSSYKQALDIDPTYTNAYITIGNTFIKLGNLPEALRFWRHGVKNTLNSEAILKLLNQYDRINSKIASPKSENNEK